MKMNMIQTNFRPSARKDVKWGFLTDRSKAGLLFGILFVTYVSCLSCCLVCSLQPFGHLLGKLLLSLLYVMFSCVCHFPMWCSGSGMVLDCTVS